MKIAVIPGQFLISPHAFILNQIFGIIDNGLDVEIITRGQIKREFITKDVANYKLLYKTHFIISPKNKLIRLKEALRIIANNFLNNGLKIINSLNFFKYGRNALGFHNLFVLNHFLHREYNIIHCHFGHIARKYIFLKELFPEIRFIVTFHGYDFSVYPLRYNNDIFFKLFSKADLITVGSNYAKQRLIALGASEEKIIVHHMGIKLDKYPPKERIWNWGEIFKIISIGRLVEKKGLEYGIRAVAKVENFYPHIEYHIFGEGPLKGRLLNLIENLNLNNKIILHGWKGHDEIPYFLEKSHLFLLPSVTASNGDVESQGVVLQEAQASGLPVVATIHNGFPDSILEGKSGFLVPERNVDALTEKLKYFLENPKKIFEMGINGRKFVENNFDNQKLCKQLVDLYKQIIFQKGN